MSVYGYRISSIVLLAAALCCLGSSAKAQTSAVLTPIYAFTGGADGLAPNGLTQGSDGNFYGTAIGGGIYEAGTVFQITPAGVLNTLYAFTGSTDGANPEAGLTLGSEGNFYGTTRSGGDSNGDGTVFRITPAGDFATLYTFTGGTDGASPGAGLTLGNDGNFYGTTRSGGDSNGDGTVFRITPAGDFATLYTFTGGADGADPYAALTEGKDGNFYGTTRSGGDSNGDGTVFRITPAGDFATLYTFTGGADGADPYAALTEGKDGNFYGTTDEGGNGYGTVFQITPAGDFATLYTFTYGADGVNPEAGLTLGSDGNFYGTTSQGYAVSGDAPLPPGYYGTVFEVTADGDFATLYTFTGGADGSDPHAALTQGSDGNFYGTAPESGQYGYGVIFRLTVTPAVTSETASAQVGTPFSYQIIATNGPVSFGASNLPAGLSINTATGLISGIPTQSGSFSVGLTATNSLNTGTGTLTINILPPAPAITSGPPPNGQVGLPYSFQVAATNSPSSFSSAGLPPGLMLDATGGVITGTPTQAGTFNVAITATNAGGSSTGMYNVTILPAVPVIISTASAIGIEGQPFAYQIAASNLPTSYNANGLPAGLNVDTASGLISGTPTTTGSFTVALSAANAGGMGTAMLTLTLTSTASLAPTITSSTAASATVGVFFSFVVTASNSPSSFGAVGLPPGLSIDASTGLISGTPTQAVTYSASISATNASGTGTGALTLTVTLPAANITAVNILSPPSDINIVVGETITVQGTVDALPGTLAAVSYGVYDATNTNLVTTLSAGGAAGNQFNWMPNALGDFYLRVTGVDTAGNSVPEGIPIHVIASPSAFPNSTLLSGLDGKTFAAGSKLPLVGLATGASGASISNATFYANGAAVPADAGSVSGAKPGQLQPKDAATSQFSQASYQAAAIGDAILTLAAKDNNGVTGISPAATLHIIAAASGAVPTCTITSPATGAQTVPGASVAVTAAASVSSGSISQVEFFSNNTSMGTATAPPYTKSIPMPADGQFALTAIATDDQGISQVSAPVIVTVAPPVVTITVAGNGEAVAGGKPGKLTIKRTGDASAPLTVRFKIAGAVTAGVDYEALSKLKVTIPAGESQAKIKITALNNPSVQGPREAKVTLLPSTDNAYTLGDGFKAKIKLMNM